MLEVYIRGKLGEDFPLPLDCRGNATLEEKKWWKDVYLKAQEATVRKRLRLKPQDKVVIEIDL